MSKKNDYNIKSEIFKALGHPVRLQVLDGLLKSDGCNVNEIVEKFKIPQSTVSQHLKVLRTNNIISFHKEGVKVCYKVINKKVIEIINILKR
ncbi:MAG: hypothetical protein B6I26_03590 [Desulfobacteraceae bacterium 4572_130]|nr:MAG: hypothetical protein B6I26_03590 [Desulfobacteraceae bacterium 4572_130]